MSIRRKYLLGIVATALLFGIAALSFHRPHPTTVSTQQDLEMLQALPYVQWSERKADPSLKGVTKYDQTRAFPGINLYACNTPHAFLMDMTGKKIHTWSMPKGFFCQHAALLENDEIIAISANKAILKMDWDSRILWRTDISAHHDVAVLPDGSYLTLTKDPPVEYNSFKVMFDSVTHLSGSGDVLEQWSVSEHLPHIRSFHPPHFLDQPDVSEAAKPWDQKGRFDYYHMNTIQVLPETDLGRRDDRFRKGNLLVCFRNVSLIAVLDRANKKIVWAWGPGILDYPHVPTMLPTGHILIFDNGSKRKYSRVVELDPVSNRIVWEYKASPPERFFSAVQGSSERLANGNTLICHSGKGHVFEINSRGEIVWEFWNPDIRAGKRRKIYRFTRYDPAKIRRVRFGRGFSPILTDLH